MTHGQIARKLTARQRRIRRLLRRLVAVFLVGCIAAGLIAADKFGVFGKRRPADRLSYHDKLARVTHVVDGDTLDVDIPDDWKSYPRTRIRLWGVDTPETVRPNCPVQYFGPQASSFARRQTLGKTVRLELLAHRTRDKYGRLLAYVYLPDGRMFNREIIVQGFGFADSRFEHPHKADFARVMAEAKKARRGLWKNPKPQDWPDYLKKKNRRY